MPWSVYDDLKDQINFGYRSLTGIVEEEKTVDEVLDLRDYNPLNITYNNDTKGYVNVDNVVLNTPKRPYKIIRDT